MDLRDNVKLSRTNKMIETTQKASYVRGDKSTTSVFNMKVGAGKQTTAKWVLVNSEWVWKRGSTLRVGRVGFSWMSCKNHDYSKHWF